MGSISFLKFKEEVWHVCNLLYTLEEAVYYERLSIFNHFAIFKDGDKVVGFLSFFLDELRIDTKSTVLIGIGHTDASDDIKKMSHKLANIRVFEDADGKIIGDYESSGLRPYTLEKARQYGFEQPLLEACLGNS